MNQCAVDALNRWRAKTRISIQHNFIFYEWLAYIFGSRRNIRLKPQNAPGNAPFEMIPRCSAEKASQVLCARSIFCILNLVEPTSSRVWPRISGGITSSQMSPRFFSNLPKIMTPAAVNKRPRKAESFAGFSMRFKAVAA